MRFKIQIPIVALAGTLNAYSQGTFQNLDFESPILPLVRDTFGFVPIENALPGWSGFLGGVQQPTVLYNHLTLGTASLDLLGPGHQSGTIFRGDYTVVLQARLSPTGIGQVDAAIAQTGTIPTDANSLRFLTFGPEIAVTFGGQTLSLVPLLSGPGLGTLLGADISAFAGQTGELRFTAPNLSSIGFPNDVFLDDISFSPQSVPEPGVFGLLALGSLLLGCRSWSRSRV